MRVSRSRLLAFGGVAAGVAGVVVAVTSALGTPSAVSGGVEAAQATRLHAVTRVVRVAGARISVTTKPGGAVCYSAPHASACASSLGGSRLSYATGRSGGRVVLAGVAGPGVKAVIARLTKQGTVWPTFRDGTFYAVLPRGHRLRAIVKVLAGGRRQSFAAS